MSSHFRYTTLARNTASLPQVDIWPGALWGSSSELRLVDRGDRKDAFQVAESGRAVIPVVPAMSVVDILRKTGWPGLDILKMDIEGAEKEVFEEKSGAWLSKVQVLLVELHEDYRPGCGQAFAAAVSKHDFQFYRRGENYVLVRRELGLSIAP